MKNLKLLRELVFGTQDGIISTLVVILALAMADTELDTIILAGLSTTLAGTFSMGIGAYLGTRADEDVELQLTKNYNATIWKPIKHGLVMCFSFSIASLVPVIIYWVSEHIIWTIGFSLGFLAMVGILKAIIVNKPIVVNVIEIVSLGSIAGIIGISMGRISI